MFVDHCKFETVKVMASGDVEEVMLANQLLIAAVMVSTPSNKAMVHKMVVRRPLDANNVDDTTTQMTTMNVVHCLVLRMLTTDVRVVYYWRKLAGLEKK